MKVQVSKIRFFPKDSFLFLVLDVQIEDTNGKLRFIMV